MENKRACGRPNCFDCPRQRVGRCQATPQQRDCHECKCGLKEHAPKKDQ